MPDDVEKRMESTRPATEGFVERMVEMMGVEVVEAVVQRIKTLEGRISDLEEQLTRP